MLFSEAARCVEIAQAALARAASNHSIRSLSSVGARTLEERWAPVAVDIPSQIRVNHRWNECNLHIYITI